MDLPEPVLQSYRHHFRSVRADAGATLHSVLRHFGRLDQSCWHLLNRVTDWRSRYATSLLEPDRMICAFWGVRTDAQNGGFHQYFSNSSGDYWPDLLRMLELAADLQGERHFRRVLSIFPDSSPSVDRAAREDQLNRLEAADAEMVSAHFDLFDAEYYDSCFYPDDDTLYKALLLIDDTEFIPDPEGNWAHNGG